MGRQDYVEDLIAKEIFLRETIEPKSDGSLKTLASPSFPR
jgi:hypothetical protein